MTSGTAPDGPPVLRVITPGATEEEIAALVAVVSALAAPPAAPSRVVPARSVWGDPARMHRATLHAGPGGWRASGLPR